ncbi:anthrone oxygenase family protein [Chelativorans sp. YIM 93263]|uniref:anthrone oxygenase family protein n=1 Tax=Chelativorans sp. YIM 93263 TaxID=2906648 RepID=UPI0023799CEF|nr:anthrone oxygenase family protein [Chelativorans sp. YIM 93263]
MDRIYTMTVLLAAAGAGVMAGFFYSFSNVVMGALNRVAPQSGIAAMQAINNVVLNPIFLLLFFGTAFLSAVIIGASLLGSVGSGAVLAAGGGAAYLVCIIGVTIIFNVPMNNALALVVPATAEGAAVWAHYLQRWTWWNHVRTLGGILSLGCFMIALIQG